MGWRGSLRCMGPLVDASDEPGEAGAVQRDGPGMGRGRDRKVGRHGRGIGVEPRKAGSRLGLHPVGWGEGERPKACRAGGPRCSRRGCSCRVLASLLGRWGLGAM